MALRKIAGANSRIPVGDDSAIQPTSGLPLSLPCICHQCNPSASAGPVLILSSARLGISATTSSIG
ncbi:MAG: hypothetical protein R2856_08650 [Caldilineaceae bacterium]